MAEIINASTYGTGFEGYMNWTNALSNNWMFSIFIIVIALTGYIVSKRKNLSTSESLILSGLIILILTPIAQLFTIVNSQIIIIGLIIIALGIGGKILEK